MKCLYTKCNTWVRGTKVLDVKTKSLDIIIEIIQTVEHLCLEKGVSLGISGPSHT